MSLKPNGIFFDLIFIYKMMIRKKQWIASLHLLPKILKVNLYLADSKSQVAPAIVWIGSRDFFPHTTESLQIKINKNLKQISSNDYFLFNLVLVMLSIFDLSKYLTTMPDQLDTLFVFSFAEICFNEKENEKCRNMNIALYAGFANV